jgi:hypothetical protein
MKLDLNKEIDRSKAETYFNKLMSDRVKVEIKKFRVPRSIDQNSFLHVCLSTFCLHTGYTINESKEIFAGMLPDLLQYEKNGTRFRKSTSDLNTKEMAELIEYVRNFCHEQLGIYIADSQQYLIDKFAIDKELESVK